MKKPPPRRVDWWYVDRVIASPMVRAVAVLVAVLILWCAYLWALAQQPTPTLAEPEGERSVLVSPNP